MRNIEIVDKREVLGCDFKVYGDFDNPLFLAKDVCIWLEMDISNASRLVTNLDEEEYITTRHNNTSATFLTEDGLYEVLMQSRKPIAKEFKKKVKDILKELRRGKQIIVPTDGQNDIFVQMMSAVSQVLSQNMVSFKEEIKREMVDTRNIITEQEIKHEQQIKQTRELIGFKSKNTNGIMQLLKTKISDLKGYTITARGDYHYQLAKQKLFEKYRVYKWEDLQIDLYSEIHADIDGIEDLDSINFK